MKVKRELIANVHIEKAAGQTFISILEKNFTYQHCRAKPFTKRSNGIFTSKDMMILFVINPFVKIISGHSVKSYSDLRNIIPNIRYVTVLRDPVNRYISQYQYWVEQRGQSIDFDQFLNDPSTHNFQIKKIVNSEDLEHAKEVLTKEFFHVGIVEEFDLFLNTLKIKLSPMRFNVIYKRQNVGSGKIKAKIFERSDSLLEQIIEKNSVDIKLYNYVKDVLIERGKSKYLDLKRSNEIDFKCEEQCEYHEPKIQFWKVYRLYYQQIIKLIRLVNGLPPNGSY